MKTTERERTLREELLRKHLERRDEIRARLDNFSRIPQDQYFYELVYCLLTPQSSAAHALAVQRKLENLRFRETDVDPEPILAAKENYIRFHLTKARLLTAMKSRYGEIESVLASGLPAFEIREWLVRSVKGFGYKESTHFLRNIGRNEGLAILDRHIIRNLVRWKIVRTAPKTLTRKQYLALEEKFQHFARGIGIPIDELDLLFWSEETGRILK